MRSTIALRFYLLTRATSGTSVFIANLRIKGSMPNG